MPLLPREVENASMMRVLVVEDNPLDFKFLRALLPEREFQVDRAASSREALGRIEQDYDVYLLDYYIDQRRGTDILRVLAERDLSGARILITSHEDDSLDSEARRLGADDFLVKGQFDRKQLKRSIRYALEKRRNEARLKKSRDRFRAIFEGALDGMVIVDSAGVVSAANPAAAKLLEPDPAPGTSLASLLEPGVWEKLKLGSPTPENILVRRGNLRLEVSCTGELHSGQVLVVLRDVTQRYDALQALTQSEERLRAFLSHTPTVVFIKDASGRYVFANSRYGELLGVSPAEIVGKTDFELWPPEVARQFTQHDRNVLATGEAREFKEFTHDGRSESTEWLVVKFPLEGGGEPLLAGLAFDVSDRKRLEEQLHHVQKMDAVGRLAGGVAHDFNNLLSVILGNLELLLATGKLTSDEVELIREVRGAGERAAVLTRKLLAFSRKQHLESMPLEIGQLVSELEEILRRLVRESIELDFEVHQDAGTVMANPGQLEQILLNLVVNARDAIKDTGHIKVGCERKYMTQGRPPNFKPGEYAVLTVEDSGEGIPAEVQRRVFEPFFTTKGLEGTGLGLSTVYGIVEQAGGRVWFDSEDGQGTVFTVLLPLTELAATPVRPAPALSTGGKPYTVLLVEDEESLRRLAIRLLKRSKHRVIECSDGEEALAYLTGEADDIDLLITDVVMPRMGGAELVRRVRETKPDLKVIFMSGYTEDSFELDEHSIFLEKPFTLASLREAVKRALTS